MGVASRHVVASQKGEAIFSMSASFHSSEAGLTHQVEMPNVPGPDELPSGETLLAQHQRDYPNVDEDLLYMVYGKRPVEIRQVEDFTYFNPKIMPPVKHAWCRSRKTLGNNQSRHQSLLAYASDVGLLSTSNMPHGKSFMTGLTMASIDHSVWFHRSFNFDDWILIAIESTVSAGSRAYSRASMFTQDGILIGSATQEGLLRETKETLI